MLSTLTQLKFIILFSYISVCRFSIQSMKKNREGSIDSDLIFQLIIWDVCIVLGKLIEWHLGIALTIGDFTWEGFVSWISMNGLHNWTEKICDRYLIPRVSKLGEWVINHLKTAIVQKKTKRKNIGKVQVFHLNPWSCYSELMDSPRLFSPHNK